MGKSIFCVTLLIFLLTSAWSINAQVTTQAQDDLGKDDYFASIGQFITGRISSNNQGITLHNYQLDQKIEKKYLFLRLMSESFMESPSLGIYDYTNRSLIKQCQVNNLDGCYLRASQFQGGQKIVVVITSKNDVVYNLKTYWGDLEHLTPNQELKFMFEAKNPTQLFHLEFKDNQVFEQIRIVLAPETSRANFDRMKIYANFGINNQPTAEKYDLSSVHIWGDSEAIFLEKNQTLNKKGVFLYIVGNAATIYTLTCEFIEKDHHDISLNEVVNEFIKGDSSYVYHVKFDQFDSSDIDEFAFKFSVFQGQIGVQLYKNKELTQKYEYEPLQYMSDIEYIFSKADVKTEIKEVFLKVYCPDASAIYQLELQGRKQAVAFKMTENIYEFVLLSESKKAMYFQYSIFDSQDLFTPKDGSYLFEVRAIKARGYSVLSFYVCLEEVRQRGDCLKIDTESFVNKTQSLKPSSIEEAGGKQLYTLTIDQKYFKSSQGVKKSVMILAIVAHTAGEGELALTALQFSNPNKVKPLREDRGIEQKIFQDQTKVYKYVNNDPNISSIKIYINEISGLANVTVTRKDPRLSQQLSAQQLPEGNKIFEFTKDVTKPVYVKIVGRVNSIYTIGVVVKHLQHPQSSALSLSQDIPYTLNIDPFQFTNVEIHPIDGKVVLKYKSKGGPISICQTNYYGNCQSQQSILANDSSSGEVEMNGNIRSIKLRISNGIIHFSNEKSEQAQRNLEIPNRISVQLYYHRKNDSHCDQKRVNEIYSEVMKANDCVRFHLPTPGELEIIVRKSDVGNNFERFFLCSKIISPIIRGNRLVITRQQFTQKCSQQITDASLMILFTDTSKNLNETIRYEYSVEYKANAITLKDGVSYTVNGISDGNVGSIRTFFYSIIDLKKDIQILLNNKKGNQKFYADITSDKNKLAEIVTQTKSSFKSTNGLYFGNPQIKVTSKDIQQSKCSQNCVLKIAIYSSSDVGTQIQFTIEVTSTSIILREDQIRNDFVSENTFKYYQYENRKNKQSLLVKLSDNNQHCANVYISKKQFPSPSNFIKKQAGGDLVLEQAQKDIYYIGVQGLRNCLFSISASQSNAKITRMQYGQFYDIKLEAGEKKIFLVRHISDKPFKVLSLKKHGSIKIYANQTDLNNQTIKKIQNNSLEYQKFSFISSFKNTLVVSNKNPNFCADCSYLLVVQAKKQSTQSSIVLVGQNAKVNIYHDKIFFDEIQNTSTITSATYYTVSQGQLLVKVHTGSINIQMSYLNETKVSKVFPHNKKVAYENYTFVKKQSTFEPIIITITGIQVPALYSIQLRPNISDVERSIKLTPGQHGYLYMTKQKKQCITGYLSNKNELIYLTVNPKDDLRLQRLTIESQIGNKAVKNMKKQIVGNILSLEFEFDSVFFKDALDYKICLSENTTDESFSVVAFQNENINLLPTNTEVLIRKENIFLMHPNGDLIVDLFKCTGQPTITYSSKLQNLDEQKSHMSDTIGIPGQSHAIRLQQYSTIYLDIKAEQATMVWIPLIQEQEKGVGYFKYSIGSLEYEGRFNSIQFKIGGVTQIQETKTQVQEIRYTLYIADSKSNLQQAVMCEKFNTSKVTKFTTTVVSNKDSVLNRSIIISIQKKRITETFKEGIELYYNVVADMILKPPTEPKQLYELQNYRFIYFEQQVSSQVFRQTKIESVNVGLLILAIFIGVVGFIVVACVFVKMIVPAIGRLKNRMFVQEPEDQKDQSVPIPPSSERNQVKTDMNDPVEQQA